MVNLKFQISATITLSGQIDPKVLNATITPENITMPTGEIRTEIINNTIKFTIVGNMSIGRLIYTIDDILNTAILTRNVYQTTEE